MLDFESLFDKKYLRWFHLPENGLLIEIAKIEEKVEMQLPNQRNKEYKPVLHYKVIGGELDKVRPLVLNPTNARLIAAIHGRDASKWIGKEVVLYTDDKVRLQGKNVNGIRIRSRSSK
jgi:hypothetical protein